MRFKSRFGLGNGVACWPIYAEFGTINRATFIKLRAKKEAQWIELKEYDPSRILRISKYRGKQYATIGSIYNPGDTFDASYSIRRAKAPQTARFTEKDIGGIRWIPSISDREVDLITQTKVIYRPCTVKVTDPKKKRSKVR